jgi:hypothetical protein
MVPRIPAAAFILSILLASVSFAAEVELKGSWTKGPEHWLVHIQVARPGFFIAPNSPAFDNEQLIRVTDAATHQPIGFRLRHDKRRMARGFDLAFPQLQQPVSVLVTVGGLSIVDQRGQRVAYQQNLAARAPASGDRIQPRVSASPSHTYAYRSDDGGPTPRVYGSPEPLVGGGAPPPNDWVPTEVGQGAPPPEPEIPQFPFPPPQASAFENIPREFLVAGNGAPKLKDVDAVLSGAFEKCGYGEKSYYAVPDGFAIASRIEQINADGSFSRNRWSLESQVMSTFSIEGYLRALFGAREGHFRVVVFVVTNHPFQQTEERVSSDQAQEWVRKGLNELPRRIGAQDFTDDYACTALIYEFKALGGGQAAFVEPSEITAQMHLEKSGLRAALSPPQ